MRLKVYRAASMAEAMTMVRGELGAEAIILATRRAGGEVEITAALEPEMAPVPCAREPAPPEASPRRDALRFHGVPEEMRPSLLNPNLTDALEDLLDFGQLDLTPSARPLLLVGPPGSGKTLTAARLATRLVMGDTPPMVITADGRRAGATEQLAAFTRLLGINLIVASHPVTLGRALTRRTGGAPVVIDGPGSDPFDPTQCAEIAALCATANARMALVLPGGIDPAEAADMAIAYARAGAEILIATRLDLSRRLGGIISAAFAGKLTLTEAGIGPGAADGLVALTPALLAGYLSVCKPPVWDPKQ